VHWTEIDLPQPWTAFAILPEGKGKGKVKATQKAKDDRNVAVQITCSSCSWYQV